MGVPPLARQRLGEEHRRGDQVQRGQSGGRETGQRVGVSLEQRYPQHAGKIREQAAQRRTEDEPEPDGGADEAHSARAVLGRGHVRDRRLRGGNGGAEDPHQHAPDEEQPERPGQAEERESDDRSGQPEQQDGTAADSIREPSPYRREKELRQRVAGHQEPHDGGARAAVVGLLMSSYSLAQFLFAPVWGRLSDRIGRRPILLLGLTGSVVGFTLFGLAGTLWLLFVGRVLMGIFGATIPTAQAAVADVTAPQDRARGMGLIGAAIGLGFILGPALGGLLSNLSGVLRVSLFERNPYALPCLASAA